MVANKSDKNSKSLLLPISAKPLCFDKNVFMKENFSVDEFVADCRRRVSLETLRQDLEVYFKLLKNAMIELINKDYADFVNLSTNLVGMDKAIVVLRKPLQKIRDDVSDTQTKMETKISEVESGLEEQKKLEERRKLLGHMHGLVKSVDKMERIQRSNGEDENSGQVLERVAGEFNQLQHHASYCKDLPVIARIRPRIADITLNLQTSLERELVDGILAARINSVHRCLNCYAMIGKVPDAEVLVRTHLVRPFMKQLMEEHKHDLSLQNIGEIFTKILELIPNHLKVLCDITAGRQTNQGDKLRGIPGYDFIVNSAWPEIVSSIEGEIPGVFSSGDPDLFHKRYKMCMGFVDKFERQCGSQTSITRLRQSSHFNLLLTHWSLPVYFQIRFQEIGTEVEKVLSNRCQLCTQSSDFKLQASHLIWESLQKCWSENVFLSALVHRFWKLTLQLMSRYRTWVKQFTGTDDKDLKLNELCFVISDILLLTSLVRDFYQSNIQPIAAKQGLKDTSILENALEVVLDDLTSWRKKFISLILSKLVEESSFPLKQAQDVPRLFRKTNRAAPTEPSQYMALVLNPIVSFHSEQSSYIEEAVINGWMHDMAVTLSERFQTVVVDVLNSVKKMEESLLRLKKMRASKASNSNLVSLGGISDEDKIRMQFKIDVLKFGEEFEICGANMSSIETFQSLKARVIEELTKNEA